MLTAPNRNRTALHNEPIADGPLTERQRALADAIRHCHALADTASAPAEVSTTIEVCKIRLGTSEEAARWQIERGLRAAEAKLARIRAIYACYGPSAFSPTAEPDDAPRHEPGETRHSLLVKIMQKQRAFGRVMTRAGDRRVERDQSGSYVLAA